MAARVIKATVEADEAKPVESAAQTNGRVGGLKGGKVRAAKLSAQRRSEIAREAAQARWQRKTTP
jgi:hypothetical protein